MIKTKTSTNNISSSKSPPLGKIAIIAPSQRLYQQQDGGNSLTTGYRADILQRPVRTICESDIEIDQKANIDKEANTVNLKDVANISHFVKFPIRSLIFEL